MSGDDPEGVEETHPGEKGPPAWQVRGDGDDGEPMADEPPDSSSEVDQVAGLFYDEDESSED